MKSTKGNTGYPREESIYGDVQGWEIMKLPDFWLLLVTFVIGSGTDKSWVTNIGTYLRSFKEEDHLHILMDSAPWISMAAKVSVGITSDLCRESVPRLTFLIGLMLIKVPLLLFFTLYGNNIVLIYILTYFLYVSFGIFFVICPILVAEYFGVVYYGRNFGSIIFFEGCTALLLQFIIGVLYDANVTELETHTCCGLHCFYGSSGIIE